MHVRLGSWHLCYYELMKVLRSFKLGKDEKPVKHVESYQVAEGVNCDTYMFVGDDSKDLAVITVKPGCKTPLQKVLKGLRTIEGFIEGDGVLFADDRKYNFPGVLKEVEVKIGQTMQWSTRNGLTFYEICEPPYEDGRFKDLD